MRTVRPASNIFFLCLLCGVAISAVGMDLDGPYLADDGAFWEVPVPPPPGASASGRVARVDEYGLENVSLRPGVKPVASSSLQVGPHLLAKVVDGLSGNVNSWILGSDTGWLELEFPEPFHVCRLAFASDAMGVYNDRAVTSFEVLVPEGDGWRKVYSYAGDPVRRRRLFAFPPVCTRKIRLALNGTSQGEPRIDELEVYGSSSPIPESALKSAHAAPDAWERAALEEELAWLKQEGWADIDRVLRHGVGYPEAIVPERQEVDVLPLPQIPVAPALNGKGGEAWHECSRGCVRVGRVTDAARAPLIEYAVEAGVTGGVFHAAVEGPVFFSAHLSLVGVPGTMARALVVADNGKLHLRRLDAKNPVDAPLRGVYDARRGRLEFAFPLRDFPGAEQKGLYVTAGIGGRHTAPGGRPVAFVPAEWSVREEPGAPYGSFKVRVALNKQWAGVVMTSPQLRTRRRYSQSTPLRQTYLLPLSPDDAIGTLGPRLELLFRDRHSAAPFRLTLFRYDPSVRRLRLFEEMAARRGMGGDAVQRFREEHAAVFARGDAAGERTFDARLRAAKRTLFLSDPALKPAASILASKRHPFHPSHNYSVQFDAYWRPGGAVCRVDLPWRDGALHPEEARCTNLVEAGNGIIRTPSLSFDAKTLYYAERTDQKEYYRIWEQDLASGRRKRLSDDQPFHDFWPTPLPDGGLAFITTRCKVKFLCWRPQAAVLFRMERDGSRVTPLSFANLTEFAPSVMDDGRIIWTRSEYVDKGADYGHTVWTIRADGTYPELTYGNTIALPQGYANARMMPGTQDLCATMISHFGDLDGPIALIDLRKGPHDPAAIRNLTPEVPRPGVCFRQTDTFREPYPLSRDLLLVAWAPHERFGVWALDRWGNRELLYEDGAIDTICPQPFSQRAVPRVMKGACRPDLASRNLGVFVVENVYRGLEGQVEPGSAKWLRICREMPTPLDRLPDGTYRADHDPFESWYASPTDLQQGAYGWASFIAKGVVGTVPIEDDGSAHFRAPSGQVLYFQLLDKDYNEIQRMRSVVQLQAGESRSCIGCHESRLVPPDFSYLKMKAMKKPPVDPIAPPWGAGPFHYEKVVQPVLDRACVRCHSTERKHRLVLEGTRDKNRVPISWRTLLNSGCVHYFTYQWQQGVPYKAPPYTFGTFRSRLWQVLGDERHRSVKLTDEECRAIKCWTDMNCPLWGDYIFRPNRPE